MYLFIYYCVLDTVGILCFAVLLCVLSLCLSAGCTNNCPLGTIVALVYPNVRQPFIVDTDASNTGFGAVLSQEDNSGERVI